jgi:outer membrane protein assembly factor BamB
MNGLCAFRVGFGGLALVALATLAACGDAPQKKLPGERLSVLLFDPTLKPDPELADQAVALTRPYVNADWPQTGGNPAHAMQHVALADVPKEAWSADIGEGSSDERRILAQPVVDDGKVFTIDAAGSTRAYRASDGHRLWRTELRPDDETGGGTLGGGLAVVGGRLFATTGLADVVALDAATGKEIWRRRVSGPIRSAPTVADGRVFVTTVESKTHALSADDGHQLWTHDGTSGTSSFLGGASPAVAEGLVVAAYSSGELFALRADNGRQVWSDYLPLPSRTSEADDLADIRASPVIYQGVVFAISNSGRMAAINLRTGARLWEQRIGGIQVPSISGDNVFIVTSDAELACLNRRDGRVRWVRALPRYEDEEKKSDPVSWTGPVLAGDRLLLGGTQGKAMALSPYTGDLLGEIDMEDPITIAPAIADKTAYFVTDDANLIALR